MMVKNLGITKMVKKVNRFGKKHMYGKHSGCSDKKLNNQLGLRKAYKGKRKKVVL